MQTQIKLWGNSVAIRVTAKMLAQLNLEVSSVVNIEVIDGSLVITSAKTSQTGHGLPFTETDLLSGLNPHLAHADSLALPKESETGDF